VASRRVKYLELPVVQEPAVGHPTAVVPTGLPHPPPPPHPPPVTTAGAARHADCGSPSSCGLQRVSHRGSWTCLSGFVLFSAGTGVRWWGGTGRPVRKRGQMGAQYMA